MATFNITVTMKDRLVNDFCSMLKCMEKYGNRGHSGLVGFYADGDGDFRPKFEIDYPYTEKSGFKKDGAVPEVIYDAG
jgi:hypothetical protein